MYDAKDVAGINYSFLGGMLSGKPGFASQCQECEDCEDKCPQGIHIGEQLKKVAEYFGK